MSRSKLLRFAAISWLPLFSLLATAQAATINYDLASDFHAKYSTSTAALAATSPTWGPAATGNVGWTAGLYSFNYLNADLASGSRQALTNYYTTSTADGNIPWVFSPLTPGTAVQQISGPAIFTASSSGSQGQKLTLPSSITKGVFAPGATLNSNNPAGVISVAGQHYLQYTAHTETPNGSVSGFGTTAQNASITDAGGGENITVGTFYNYGSYNSNFTTPASATSDALYVGGTGGPTVDRWTAPADGTVTINAAFFDGKNASTGVPSGYIVTSAAGPSAPIFSVLGWNSSDNVAWSNSTVFTTQGTGSVFSGAGGTNGFSAAYTEATYSSNGTIAVTAGETIDFVVDNFHDWVGSHSAHPMGGASDPIQISAQIAFTPTPEPSSIVLIGMAAVGLALAAWKRRRAA